MGEWSVIVDTSRYKNCLEDFPKSQNFLETAEDDEAPVSSIVKRHKIGEGGLAEQERLRQRREALKRKDVASSC
jgi:hypothetical protein